MAVYKGAEGTVVYLIKYIRSNLVCLKFVTMTVGVTGEKQQLEPALHSIPKVTKNNNNEKFRGNQTDRVLWVLILQSSVD